MKQIFFLFVLFFSISGLADTIHWKRHVLFESKGYGDKLLLVIDIPDDPNVLQRVVYRKTFHNKDLKKFKIEKNNFENTKALITQEKIEFIQESLWPLNKDHWTWDDEKSFSIWVEGVGEDFMKGSGIKVDCADFYIALRWIYAHDHGLPVGNTLAGSKKLFGSWLSTTEWQSLPYNKNWREDERFKSALRYILENSYTHSLLEDLYPVDLKKEYVTPGSVNIFLKGGTGHTQPLTVVGPSPECPDPLGCIISVWANMPASESVYSSVPELRPLKSVTKGGFMRYRWPILKDGNWSLVNRQDMPGYSLSQYQVPSEISYWDFELYVYNQLELGDDLTSKAVMKGFALYTILNLRANVTIEAHYLCHLNICEEDSSLFEDYSTYSRDKRAIELQKEFLELAKNVDPENVTWQDFISRIWGGAITYPNETTPLGVRDYVFNPNLPDLLNSDPRVSHQERWGYKSSDIFNNSINQIYVWGRIWHTRYNLVKAAVKQCTSPDKYCDPKLNTERLDSGLRIARNNLRSVSDENILEKLKTWSKTQPFIGGAFCPWNVQKLCTTYDYLLSEHAMVDRMTSDPRDNFNQRMGIKVD